MRKAGAARRCLAEKLDPLPHTFNIGVFKSVENNFTTIKHIYNESGQIIEGCICNVDFAPAIARISHKRVSVIHNESMVTRACLRYTRDYLTSGICSLINPLLLKKDYAISRHNHHSLVMAIHNGLKILKDARGVQVDGTDNVGPF